MIVGVTPARSIDDDEGIRGFDWIQRKCNEPLRSEVVPIKMDQHRRKFPALTGLAILDRPGQGH